MDLGNYGWLTTIGTLPRMVSEALNLWDVEEKPGGEDNPEILKWAQEVGGDVAASYDADSIPWCGLTMAVVARRAGKTPPANPLWALNWRNFGQASGQPDLGDIIVFTRDGGGHVGLYVGEDSTHYHVLGGNQNDKVCIGRYIKERLLEARKPLYMNAPATAIPILLDSDGRRLADAIGHA
ncbi:TIGR02594 family protein [uncultured Sphingomonas sp.]|uniref:TIGR02594 family protein n=1 Tax=uncultured Sphingomonas sp. TaxID=158754 RepID=UPI0025DD812F|nr:TIGR02594 family protein [uncultured Sphingomonas sp.]